MRKKLTQEEFVERATQVHGGKYDYSKTEYNIHKDKVRVICPIHGEFWQRADNHLMGRGCPKCSGRTTTEEIRGEITCNKKAIVQNPKSKQVWQRMKNRCYDRSWHDRHTTYIGCSVCDEWKVFANFEEWFNKHYIEGWALDKDILVKGNKVYSPDTCCFVPQDINQLFTKRKKKDQDTPVGVKSYRTHDGENRSFYVSIGKGRKNTYLGCFRTKEEAFSVYKTEKERHIKELADKYKDQLDPKVYKTLYNYSVEIDD